MLGPDGLYLVLVLLQLVLLLGVTVWWAFLAMLARRLAQVRTQVVEPQLTHWRGTNYYVLVVGVAGAVSEVVAVSAVADIAVAAAGAVEGVVAVAVAGPAGGAAAVGVVGVGVAEAAGADTVAGLVLDLQLLDFDIREHSQAVRAVLQALLDYTQVSAKAGPPSGQDYKLQVPAGKSEPADHRQFHTVAVQGHCYKYCYQPEA